MSLYSLLLWSYFCKLATSQFPPEPQGVNTIQSHIEPGVSISYKQTDICETTPGVKSFSGYVHLPSTLDPSIAPYPNNLFFWFFESRKDPANAPLVIFIQGGPGFSSVQSAVSENGPCNINSDSNSTTLNPWSWNNEANVLYIDQPTQTGFSYDVLTNGTLNQFTTIITPADFSSGTPKSNNTFVVGTFASQNQNATANTTANGAPAMWHFAQTWLQEFPAYRPAEDKIHLWTESFGGRYGPAYVSYFEEQNQKIKTAPQNAKKSIPIQVETLGIINGCADFLSQGAFYPEMAFNNTYGLEAITPQAYEDAKFAFSGPGGCRSLVETCRALAANLDPHQHGIVPQVNEACAAANTQCEDVVAAPFLASGRSIYDISQVPTATFPPVYLVGYFNQAWVQAALGVPVNFTVASTSVSNAFTATGDDLLSLNGSLDDLGQALDLGVRVAMIYGDRDYLCNWLGGENLTLNIKHEGQKQFKSAGYEKIKTNGSYVGGMVRQAGPLSFSRVFEAGHEVPAFQPETAYRIFMRTINQQDVATGSHNLIKGHGHQNYHTQGPSSVFNIKNVLPVPLPTQCYTWQLNDTCTPDQQEALLDGSAIVKDYIVLEPSM